MTKKITSTEFIRKFGKWQREALKSPVTITHHGRDTLVILDPEEYQRLLKCNIVTNKS